ncbi:MAG TPA: HAMP domain-containing sensor histidine kinase, partial [Pseudomonadales bacterium]|nr:HAMP domain-containing sensor histidine kinase [Pseudomonadales bacterium]
HSGRRLLEVVNDVLDYSRLQSGDVETVPTLCSLNTLGRSAIQSVSQMANAKSQKTSFSIEPEHITILTDERHLQKIFHYLLSNACKFTPDGGEFGIEIVGNRQENLVTITVWDNGIGIKQEDLPRLFQPFHQLDAALSRQFEGTGLGLTLAKHLIELLGGSIQVESSFGQGSRFIITLPWTQ